MREADALPLVRQMCAALGAAHEAGVVHRDFKSANVLLCGPEEKPRVVVTDFGLACTAPSGEELTALTESRQILGTPDYMAPEQLMAGKATPATDVYALGLIIHEMVTGKRPFDKPHQRLTATPTPVKSRAHITRFRSMIPRSPPHLRNTP